MLCFLVNINKHFIGNWRTIAEKGTFMFYYFRKFSNNDQTIWVPYSLKI